MPSSDQLKSFHPSLQPDKFYIEYPDKIIVVPVQSGYSAASHFGSLLRFRRDISTIVSPECVAKCLPGALARRQQQTAFENEKNPPATMKRAHTGKNVNRREREPTPLNEVDDEFFVDLRHSSSAERLRHAQQIVKLICLKEKRLDIDTKPHLDVGRHYGKTIASLLKYCQGDRKSGYVRLQESHRPLQIN